MGGTLLLDNYFWWSQRSIKSKLVQTEENVGGIKVVQVPLYPEIWHYAFLLLHYSALPLTLHLYNPCSSRPRLNAQHALHTIFPCTPVLTVQFTEQKNWFFFYKFNSSTTRTTYWATKVEQKKVYWTALTL